MNIRFFVSNMEGESYPDSRSIYLDFYVQRGEHSENRIKEVKNMCYSDRLSTQGFWSNFFRLFLSCLAYEMFLYLKKAIRKTKFKKAWKWQIDTIRTLLLKVGGTIKKTKRKIYYKLSSSFVYQDLFGQLLSC